MRKNSPLVLGLLVNLSWWRCADAFVITPATTIIRTSRSSTARSVANTPAQTSAPIQKEEYESPSSEQEQFNWHKQWYPLTVVDFLDPDKPHKYQILGQDVVIWNDAPASKAGLFGPLNKKNRKKNQQQQDGTWRAFVDECPHRKVPLSEGRIEGDGSLLCSYHGWRFDGHGELLAVPQLESSDVEKIQNNPKSNCNAFPTKVIEGVLWVWTSSDANSILESELSPPKHAPILSDDEAWKGNWNIRELPYGHDFFIENVVDPAHVPVSHHGIVGNRYEVTPSKINTLRELTNEGFTIQDENTKATTEFHAPSHVLITANVGSESKQYLELYSTPSRPGFCHHVGRMVIKGSRSDAALLRQYTLPLPTWLNHLMASLFLNQDGLFLHHQERHLAKSNQYKSYDNINNNDINEGKSYSKSILPVNSDKGVLHYRNWIRYLAGGQIPYANESKDLTMPPSDNNVVFDVWNSHTKYCKVCQDALSNLKKIRFATFLTSVCIGVIRPFKSSMIANLMSTLLTAGVGLLLNKLIGLFYRYEFSHAHND